MNGGGCSVVSSLKSLWRNCHINNPKDRPLVAGGLRLLILGPPDRWSRGCRYAIQYTSPL